MPDANATTIRNRQSAIRSVPEPLFDQQRRVILVAMTLAVIVSLGMVGVLGRVVQLQSQPDPNVTSALEARTAANPLMARRGALLDARGRLIAASDVGYRLFADPALIDDPAEFAAHVAHAVGDDPARIDRLISERFDTRYVELVPVLEPDQLEAVRTLDLPGLGAQPRIVRVYPQGPLAGQVVGFVGSDQNGLGGLEFALNSVLSGDGGVVHTLRDVRRRALWIEQSGYRPPQDGYAVRLSIDMAIQGIADTELAKGAEQYRAESANLIVMDSRTGQILAMSNWPPFDPADAFGATSRDHLRNRCVTDPYEPGSIFKPFIWSAATAAGAARPDEKIDCTTAGVWVSSKGRRLRDAHGHGTTDWNGVLIFSSNIGMAKVGERMGATKLHAALGAFGFGSRTGSDLPGESPGIVNPLRKWTHYSVTSVPMGQEISTTALQMARAFSAFANSGVMVTPSILAGEARSPVLTRAVSADAADKTRMVLRRVITEGTGKRADSKLYQVWGKTGTAQVAAPDRRGYLPDAYTASFICGAPLHDPRIIVIVTVHHPDKKVGHFGGVVAAPIAKEVVEQTLQYLRVAPDAEDAVRSSPIALGDQFLTED